MILKKGIVVFSLLISSLLFGQTTENDITFTQDEINWMQDNLQEMRYAPNPSWAPGDYIDEDGNHQGIISDYIKIFEEELNVDFNHVYYADWKGMYSGLLNNEIDFLGAMQVTEERKQYFAFTKPVLDVPIVIIVNKNKTYDFKDNNLDGMKIAAMRSYITQDHLLDNYTNFELNDCADELEALIKTSLGTTDGAIVDIMTASFLVDKYGITNLSIGTELDFVWHLAFAFRKEHETFAQIIDKILETIDEEQRQQIYTKWVKMPYVPKQNFFQKNYKLFVGSLILFLLITIVFLFYATVLRRLVRIKTHELNKELKAKNQAIFQSQKNEARLESLFELSKITTDKSVIFLDYALTEIAKLTESNVGILYKYDVDKNDFILSNKFTSGDSDLSAGINDSFIPENLDGCKPYILGEPGIQINSCKNCPLHKNRTCPIVNFQHGHTLIFPITDENKPEGLLFLRSDKQYNEKDSQQVVLFVGAAWQLLTKQRWQEELINAKAKAEESDRLKTAFLANISHEIRTPMNGIVGFTELLNSPDLSDEDRKSYINIINKSTNYLLSVITDIVEISKIESGLVQPNSNNFAIDEFFENVLKAAKNMLAGKALKIILENKGEKHISIQSDEIKLQQVIINLVSNAIKYTDTGQISIQYRVKDNQYLEIKVKDTGLGIDEKYHKVIFERFRQGDKEQAILKGGTGLGLSIANSYIKMLGGEIQLDSALGKGSVFTVNVPVEVTAINREEEPDSFSKNYSKAASIKVLIAEDQYLNYLYLKEILKEIDCTIIHAKNGIDALELFYNNPDIEIILLDIKMPLINGYQVIEKIRESNNNIPVIAQTAYALQEDYLKFRDAGFNDYISKPIDKRKLLQLLLKYTNQIVGQ